MAKKETGTPPPKNEPVKIDSSTPLVIKDVEGPSRWNRFTKSFTEAGKLQRDMEKAKLKEAKKNVEKQLINTKKLQDEQAETNNSIAAMQKTIDEKDTTGYLEEIVKIHGRNSQEAEATRKSIEDGDEKFETGQLTITKLQEAAVKQGEDIKASDTQSEIYEKTLNAEKKREGGIGQKMMLKSLDTMKGFMKGMYESTMKVAKTGLKGAFIALGIMALLEFLESDTWKKVKKSIGEFIKDDKLTKWWTAFTEGFDKFWDYLFAPAGGAPDFKKGGLFTRIGAILGAFVDADTGEFTTGSFLTGIAAVWKNLSGIELLVGSLALMFILPKTLTKLAFKGAWKLVTGSLGLFMNSFKSLANMIKGGIPKVPGGAKVPQARLPAGSPGGTGGQFAKPGAATTAGTMAKKGGGAMGKISKILKPFAHLKKYPMLMTAAKRIPLLGPILSSVGVISLLMSDASHRDKVKGVGGLIGGGLGAAGFGLVGAALGGIFTGPGAIVAAPLGGLIGSLVGWLGGEWAGSKLAGFLMGEDPDLKGMAEDAPQGTGAIPKAMPGGGGGGDFGGKAKLGMSPGAMGGKVGAMSSSVTPLSNSGAFAKVMSINAENVSIRSAFGAGDQGGQTAVVNAPVSNVKTTNTQVVAETAQPVDRRLQALNGGAVG